MITAQRSQPATAKGPYPSFFVEWTIGGASRAAKAARSLTRSRTPGQALTKVRLGFGRGDATVDSFEFDEQDKQSAECKLSVLLGDRESLDAVRPMKGDPFRVRWGYPGQWSDTFTGRIHSVKPTYGAQPKLEVVARDLGHGMGHYASHAIYANSTLGGVVDAIAKHWGLQVDRPRDVPGVINGVATLQTKAWASGLVGPVPNAPSGGNQPNHPLEAKILAEVHSLASAGRSDRALLHWIAHRTGCEMQVDGKTLRFRPYPHAAAPHHLLQLRHRDSILVSFSVEESDGTKPELAARGVKAAGIDPDTKKAFSFTAKDGTVPGRPVLGNTSPFGGVLSDGAEKLNSFVSISSKQGGAAVESFASAVTGAASTGAALLDAVNPTIRNVGKQALDVAGAIVGTPSGKPSDAKRNATAAHGEGERGGIKAKAQLAGIPTVRKSQVVEVRGLGARDAGKYMITGTSHKFTVQAGYTLSFDARRQGQNHKRKNEARTRGRPNESRPGEPGKAPVAAYLVDSKQAGAIVGRTTL